MLHMKWRAFLSPALLLATGVLVSCVSSPRGADNRPRFHEAASANIVLRHYRWEQIHIMQPQYREDGFLIALSRDTVGPAVDRLAVRRDLAVVILGWGYEEQDLAGLVTDWENLLLRQGFKRIVCLRAGADKKIDGLLIIDDTEQSDVTPKQTAGS